MTTEFQHPIPAGHLYRVGDVHTLAFIINSEGGSVTLNPGDWVVGMGMTRAYRSGRIAAVQVLTRYGIVIVPYNVIHKFVQELP